MPLVIWGSIYSWKQYAMGYFEAILRDFQEFETHNKGEGTSTLVY